jgi:riboflavin synthase
MFSGIVHTTGTVTSRASRGAVFTLGITAQDALFFASLTLGASVCISGVCLTLARQEGAELFFDVVSETATRSTLGNFSVGTVCNMERALAYGGEVGGHLVSGHVFGMTPILAMRESVWTFQLQDAWGRYVQEKGFVAVDGVSLTVVSVDRVQHVFIVAFIPETVARTTFGIKQVGDMVNIEVDGQTQIIVDTLERYMVDREQKNA